MIKKILYFFSFLFSYWGAMQAHAETVTTCIGQQQFMFSSVRKLSFYASGDTGRSVILNSGTESYPRKNSTRCITQKDGDVGFRVWDSFAREWVGIVPKGFLAPCQYRSLDGNQNCPKNPFSVPYRDLPRVDTTGLHGYYSVQYSNNDQMVLVYQREYSYEFYGTFGVNNKNWSGLEYKKNLCVFNKDENGYKTIPIEPVSIKIKPIASFSSKTGQSFNYDNRSASKPFATDQIVFAGSDSDTENCEDLLETSQIKSFTIYLDGMKQDYLTPGRYWIKRVSGNDLYISTLPDYDD